MFTDLRNLVWQMNLRSKSPAVKAASKELFSCLEGLVVAHSGMNNSLGVWDYSRFTHGLGIKILPYEREPQAYQNHDVVTDTPYADLKLSRDSQWDEFLAWAARLYY